MAEKITTPGSIEWQTKAEKPVAKITDEGEEAGGQNTLTVESGCNTASIEMAGAVKVATWGLEAPSQERVEKTLLQKKGESDFLQLVSTAKRKVNFGSAKLKWSASALSESKTIEHGLGVEPVYVGLISNPAPEPAKVPVPNVSSKTTTTFTVNAETKNSHTGEITMLWVAIG